MINFGLFTYFLGIEVKQIENGIFISQAKYSLNVLKRFNMQDKKPTATPTFMGLKLSKQDCNNNFNMNLHKSMVDNLMYLATTRPAIMYAVS